ncbi:MAG: type I-E CRISPR-associated protein Cas5/CasD [Thermomicrobiales bacterium]|nr:type I-E CRISPR-associated protein Cas5/CasD [Thermomicrobiales bacterium]
MATLLLRLAGPMQSWGTQSRFGERDTGLEPSKSGVIGLICAAMGRPRDASVDDLSALRMGVRVNREGAVRRDYHTLGTTVRVDGRRTGTVLSNRYYLADADFLVGLEAPGDSLLIQIEQALDDPQWQLFLGRKSFVPGRPIALPKHEGIRTDCDLCTALREHPWNPTQKQADQFKKAPAEWSERLRFVIEVSPQQGAERRIDQPASGAAFLTRQYLPRYVKTDFCDIGDGTDKVPIGEVEDV